MFFCFVFVFHLFLDIWCLTPTTTNNDQLYLVSKTWSETTNYRESGCISALPSLNRFKTENKDIPNITNQMNSVHLLDNIPQNYHHDFHVDFLNLKSMYFSNAMEEEDSLVYVFLKSSTRIERVKVYLKEWRTSDILSIGKGLLSQKIRSL